MMVGGANDAPVLPWIIDVFDRAADQRDARRRAVNGSAQARRRPQGKPAVLGLGRVVAHRK